MPHSVPLVERRNPGDAALRFFGFEGGFLTVVLVTAMPVVSLAIMFGLTQYILAHTVECSGSCLANVPAVTLRNPLFTFGELRARLGWGISVLFVVLTTGTVYLTSLVALRTIHDLRIRLAAQGFTIVAIGAFLEWEWSHATPNTFTYPFNEPLIGQTVYHVSPSASRLVTLVEALGHSALLVLAVVVGSLMWQAARARQLHGGDPILRASLLRDYLRYVRLLLLVGAAALAAGAMQAGALYSWGQALFVNAPGNPQYLVIADDLPHTLGALTGAFYSIMLASIFGGPLIVLRAWAESIADAAVAAKVAGAEGTPEEFLSRQGIDLSMTRHLGSIAALLAPLVAGGPLQTLVANLT
jgi:hypothetical protein